MRAYMKFCVIGGTGTIGSIIIEYLKTRRFVESIRVFSNDENSLWEAQQKWGNKAPFRYLLGDIRNKDRVERALRGCDCVFNCAAIKHVSFAEYNPMEAVSVNILGLENIIDACIINKVKCLIHISTDKAVKPTCVMGATKQIGEKLLQMRWFQNNPYNNLKITILRSGNVWGSRGSIVKLIEQKKQEGKPIPLTDPKMVRYFITAPQLIECIIDAIDLYGAGDIIVPKLEPMFITDLIGDAPYEVIGKRNGEKLEEMLLTKEELNRKTTSLHKNKYWVIRNEFL